MSNPTPEALAAASDIADYLDAHGGFQEESIAEIYDKHASASLSAARGALRDLLDAGYRVPSHPSATREELRALSIAAESAEGILSGTNPAPAPAGAWIKVDDSDPKSIPDRACRVMVAARVPFQSEGFHITESLFMPSWQALQGHQRQHPPARKTYGKYSRHFETCWHGYAIHFWQPLPQPPSPDER